MASFNKYSRHHHYELKFVVTFAGGLLIFALLCCLPGTDGGKVSNWGEETGEVKVGSRPPKCEGKCSNCRPCVPTLIAPIHQGKVTNSTSATASKEDDSTYYLLAWRCKCENKLFQP